MNYQLDVKTQIYLNKTNFLFYFFYSFHRTVEPKIKSKWIISLEEEANCFVFGQNNKWVELNCSWGLVVEKNLLVDIGTNRFGEPLKIAKFVNNPRNSEWHGYPADYVRNSQDRPSTPILLKWKEEKIIAKHQVVKIRQGKICNL
ncbi:hypothetical protein [Fibrivirga algicola]|uniref:Uncharacterized protein n=1 Tax=Fibrivirga algicola TaxID=2950420 RepID=A0ABX0QMK7_9BACT|nr:hypothetical protein [Fibrivirga algicola]NID13362.1 hypothetical protein [Fibrivirga algicola]